MQSSTAIDRVAISLPEARLEHGLSQRRQAALSGASPSSIRKVERGGRVTDPALLVRIGVALIVLDVYRPPLFDNDVDVLLRAASSGRWAA
jgi:transcriptional regulator with XRE-family HTH domain